DRHRPRDTVGSQLARRHCGAEAATGSGWSLTVSAAPHFAVGLALVPHGLQARRVSVQDPISAWRAPLVAVRIECFVRQRGGMAKEFVGNGFRRGRNIMAIGYFSHLFSRLVDLL